MYKIVHGLSPNYLLELLPPTTAERNPYAIRERDMYTLIPSRTEAFRNSYIPNTIRDWNILPEDIRNSPSVQSFKSQLHKTEEFSLARPPAWYSYGARHPNISLARMRNKCSALAHDLYINHIRISPRCANCNMNSAEDANHYFLQCPKYTLAREEIITTLQNLDIPCTIQVILHGSKDHNYEINKVILDSIHNYITQSNRF